MSPDGCVGMGMDKENSGSHKHIPTVSSLTDGSWFTTGFLKILAHDATILHIQNTRENPLH